jgi:biopolymer transport protein ExbD
VQPYGRLLVGTKEVNLATLNAEVAKSLDVPNPQAEQVAIKADPKVRYQDFMTVLNTLQYGGYYKIGLITENL